jgi:serine/threonine protein kinase
MSHRDPAERLRELEQLVGRTVAGKYVVGRLIGRGGMGAVYEGENVSIGKKVALKFVDREYARDETVVGRFAREARAASAIDSEHIVQVFDAGSDDGRPFLVMELLRGEDLGARLRRLDKIPLEDALHVVAQVLRGLARAHAAGIVHRDLKPDNVILIQRGADPDFVKIVDFGISKIERPLSGTAPLALTHAGVVVGTPLYMSPEQAQAFPDVDGRADLYSVGAMLFECLAGRAPHTGPTYEQILIAICTTDAPDIRAIVPSVPDDVAELIARALARDRTRRFASAAKMLAAIHAVAPIEASREPLDDGMRADAMRPTAPPGPPTSVTWAAPPERPPTDVPAPRRGSRIALPLTAFVATLTGVALTMWVAMGVRARGPKPPAPHTTDPVAATAPAAPPLASAPPPVTTDVLVPRAPTTGAPAAASASTSPPTRRNPRTRGPKSAPTPAEAQPAAPAATSAPAPPPADPPPSSDDAP